MSGKALAFSEAERAIPPGLPGWIQNRNSNHPLGHPPQRLIFGIEEFEYGTPLVVPPLVETVGH